MLWHAVCDCKRNDSMCVVREDLRWDVLHAAVEAILAARLARVEALHQGVHQCVGGMWGNIAQVPCPTTQALASVTRSWTPCPIHASQNLTDGPCRECALTAPSPALAAQPVWCTCPSDCDCDGELVCAVPAGTTGTCCEQPPGHEGEHASGIRVGWGPRGRSIHRWSPALLPTPDTDAQRGGGA